MARGSRSFGNDVHQNEVTGPYPERETGKSGGSLESPADPKLGYQLHVNSLE